MIRAIELLVSRGHNEYDVLHNYSFRKVNALSKASNKNMILESKFFAIAVREGSNANDRAFQKWLKE